MPIHDWPRVSAAYSTIFTAHGSSGSHREAGGYAELSLDRLIFSRSILLDLSPAAAVNVSADRADTLDNDARTRPSCSFVME